MKRAVIMLVALWATVSMADYVNLKDTYGLLSYFSYWEGDVVPSGSSTGLVTSAATSAVVTGAYWNDVAVRQTGGYVISGASIANPGGDFTMRGGLTEGSGVTTIYEIEDSNTAHSSYTNLYVDGVLQFYSQSGNDMELSLLSGHIEAGAFRLNSKESATSNRGTFSLSDGIFHAGSLTKGGGNINFLVGGTGEMTIDTLACDITAASYQYFGLNFETGTECTLTFGARDGYSNAQGVFEQLIEEGRVSVDGTVTTNAALFDIVNSGTASSIELISISPFDYYAAWAAPYGLTDTNGTAAATADADSDGLSNLAEYAIDGNPVDFSNRGYGAETGMSQDSGTNWYLYVRYERANKEELGLSYTPEYTVDLLSSWTSVGFETVGVGSYNAEFNVVTNRISVGNDHCGFSRVKIEMQ